MPAATAADRRINIGERTMLEVDGVHKRFRIPTEQVHTLKERIIHPRRREHRMLEAVNDVSFSVREGDFFGVVGRNGSGKSTLLKCIAGIYEPNEGVIRARGRMATFIELGVGFNPELDARDNVLLNATLLGLTATQARERFDEIIAFAELEDFVEMKLKNFSSGMQVRLAFAVALQADADILLVDEVLAVGDAAFQEKCFDVFYDLRARGKTVLFVTHNMTMVERFCTRAMMLDRGRLVALGDPIEVAQAYNDANFDRAAIGDPASKQADGAARIIECWVENAAGERAEFLPPGEWLTIKTRVVLEEDLEDPIFSLTIRDSANVLAFNTNTSAGKVPTGRRRAGEEIVHELRLRNYLGEGEYHLSPSVVRSDGTTLVDARERIGSFWSAGERTTAGFVDMPNEQSVHG